VAAFGEDSLDFRCIFAYAVGVWNPPESAAAAGGICDFAVTCKRCRETIPAPVLTLPDTWIIADCPLCGERRAYLPTDIFRGRLSFRFTRKPVRSERRLY
jgi:hypothetical protein